LGQQQGLRWLVQCQIGRTSTSLLRVRKAASASVSCTQVCHSVGGQRVVPEGVQAGVFPELAGRPTIAEAAWRPHGEGGEFALDHIGIVGGGLVAVGEETQLAALTVLVQDVDGVLPGVEWGGVEFAQMRSRLTRRLPQTEWQVWAWPSLVRVRSLRNMRRDYPAADWFRQGVRSAHGRLAETPACHSITCARKDLKTRSSCECRVHPRMVAPTFVHLTGIPAVRMHRSPAEARMIGAMAARRVR
jgi:hypothetical protein